MSDQADTENDRTGRVQAGRPNASWFVNDSRNAILGSAAIALRQYIAAHGCDRFGVCAERKCAHVFVDTSPGGRRRFCSLTSQNRARVAAFRSRRTGA